MRKYGYKGHKRHHGKVGWHKNCPICLQYHVSKAASRRRNHPLRNIRTSEARIND